MMAFINGKSNSKVLTAVILIIALIATYAMPMAVFAAVPDGGGSAGQIVSNGTTQSFSTGAAVISKMISGTSTENQFDITLKVETKNRIEQATTYTGTELVIVIDNSYSMIQNNSPKMNNAKTAAMNLVNEILTGAAVNYNKIGVVSFAKSATSLVTLSSDAAAVKATINSIQAVTGESNYGTNIQAGLKQAQTMLSANNGAKKYIVLLSDGEPNRSYLGTSATSISTGVIRNYPDINAPTFKITQFNYGSEKAYEYNYALRSSGGATGERRYDINNNSSWRVSDNGLPTISEALIARGKNIEIYTIGFGLDTNTTAGKQATFTLGNCASDADHYKPSAADLTSISNVFKGITQSILIQTQAWKVIDPMGQFITLKDFVPSNGATVNGSTINWDLKSSQVTPVIEYQGTTPIKYTYTLKYTVVLDTNAVGFVPETAYATNGTTTLTYTIGSGTPETLTLKSADYTVPKVKGQLPKFEVTVKYYEVSSNGTVVTPLGEDKNVTLAAISKGMTYGAVAANVKENWRGTGAGQLSPSDYYSGEIQGPNTLVSTDNRIISVYYKKILKMPYTVNYYKDQATGTQIGTTTSAVAYVTGAAIDNISGLENIFLPANYRLKSVLSSNGQALSSTNPLRIDANAANNMIKVVYEPIPKYQYNIQYYLGSSLQSNATVTGSAFEGSVVTGSSVTLKTFPNWHYSNTVYGSGGGNSLAITSSPALNVIKVYYAEDSKYLYSIQHIALDRNGNEISTPIKVESGTSEYAGTTISGVVIAGKVLTQAQINGISGYENKKYSNSGDIEFNGADMGVDFTITSGSNVVKIYYQDAPIYGYTVNYFNDGDLIESVPVAASEGYYAGTELSASNISEDYAKPANHHWSETLEGTESIGSTFTITSDGNVINVYYVEDTKFGYTVEYYAPGYTLPTVTSEGTYYAGTIIDTVDDNLNLPAGYGFDKIVWGDEDTATSLEITSTEANNVIKVYYKAQTGTSFTVKHYKQLDDGTYSTEPSNIDDESGETDTIVLAADYVKAGTDYIGYSYDSTVEGSVTSAAIVGSGTTVLKLYYNQVKAPLNLKHYYGLNGEVVTKDPVEKRIGTPVTVAQERRYGYKLDHIDVNGERYEGTTYQGTMESNEGDGLLVEFYYVEAESMIELNRHYNNLTTGINTVIADDFEMTDMVANLIESAKNVWEGITYKLVGATIKSEVAVEIIDQLKAAIADLMDVYDDVVLVLDPEDIAAAEAQYGNDISGAAITLQNAKDAFDLKKQELAAVRDNDPDVASTLNTLTAAQAAYDAAVRTVVMEGLAFADGELDSLTYEGILAKYDALIDAAELEVATQTTIYNAAAEDAISDATIAEQQALTEAQNALDAATEPVEPDQADFGDDVSAYETARSTYFLELEAYNALVDAVTQAELALETAESNVVIDDTLRDALNAAETALADLEGYKADFIAAVGDLQEKADLDTANQNYQAALTAALNQYLEAVAKSEEQKAVDEAQSAFDETDAAAKATYNQTIRTLVKAADPELADQLQAAEEALSEAMEAAGVEEYDVDDIMLLEAYEFNAQTDYIVDIYYEYKAEPSDPDDPNPPRRPDRDDDDPIIIKDDEVPASPTPDAIILDDAVPAGPLPKTGGLDALLMYGLGALLAGGGLILKRKEKVNK